MSSSKKAIIINPEFFSLKKNRSIKKQPREKIPKNKTGKQQKKELLKRLKDIQERKSPSVNNEPTPTDNNVLASIQFLNTLTKEAKPAPPVAIEQVNTAPTPPPTHAPAQAPTHAPAHALGIDTNQKEPPYSNIKGSKKPSYREWLKQSTETITIQHEPVSQPVPLNQLIQDNLREEKLQRLQKKYKKQQKLQRLQKTIKVSETFGKRNGKVAIHIKNKEEKDKLEHEKKTLKKHTIPKVKAYLKEHNLLKIGSYAPNDVLREMYESAILSGDINNNNKDILVHNFMEN
jgi:hypothetical protein